jgi:hypothetical protein
MAHELFAVAEMVVAEPAAIVDGEAITFYS